MVLALAGDSTMTRFSAMSYCKSPAPKTKNRGRAAEHCISRRAPSRSMRGTRTHVHHETAETLDRELLTRLAREHHEHHPAQLLGVRLVGLERQEPLDDDLALRGGEDVCALELQEQPAALGREARELAVAEHAHAALRLLAAEHPAVLVEGEIGEPVERALDVARREAGVLQVAREMRALGHLRRLAEHVPVEDVDQNVENAASHRL